MCNLFSNHMPVDAMRQLFGVGADNDALGNTEPLPAIFPKGTAPIVGVNATGDRWLKNTHWGFVLPMKSRKTGEPIQPKAVNNARDDKLRVSPFWKSSFQDRRCLVPATSFCEAKGSKPATYVWFGLEGQGARPPLAFAGVWRTFKGLYGTVERELITSSIVTTKPNELVRETHPDRMPVILHPDDYETWLTGRIDDAFDLIRPYPAVRMVIHQQGEGMKSDPA
jgi:putative SOS response-associated peptidase YedK